MRYIGSKGSAAQQVLEIVSNLLPEGKFCDPFGGMGVVGCYFKQQGYSVWTGDILTFAHYFQISRLVLNQPPLFIKLLEKLQLDSNQSIEMYLNRTFATAPGWLTAEYAIKRKFFTLENAFKIDSCFQLIHKWNEAGLLIEHEFSFLCASLIESMDKVANTAGTYYAYLKQYYRKALKPFEFQFIKPTQGRNKCSSHHAEAQQLVSMQDFDIIYLDPPYNARSYGAYYHLPETIACGKMPELKGKSGIPVKGIIRSDYNCKAKAKESLEKLLSVSRFNFLLFHYTSDGLITSKELVSVLSDWGTIKKYSLYSKGYTTNKACRQTEHDLYLVSHA
jgi:adenine-specific DNA-methyltransferase